MISWTVKMKRDAGRTYDLYKFSLNSFLISRLSIRSRRVVKWSWRISYVSLCLPEKVMVEPKNLWGAWSSVASGVPSIVNVTGVGFPEQSERLTHLGGFSFRCMEFV